MLLDDNALRVQETLSRLVASWAPWQCRRISNARVSQVLGYDMYWGFLRACEELHKLCRSDQKEAEALLRIGASTTKLMLLVAADEELPWIREDCNRDFRNAQRDLVMSIQGRQDP